MGKRKQGKEGEFWGWLCCTFMRGRQGRPQDKMTVEQKPEGGEVEHLLDVGWREEHFRLRDQSAGAEALRQRPFVL